MGYFIAPEVESLTTNSIKIQNINKQLTNSRVVSLKGVPIRIEINSDKKWVEIKSYVDVNLDKYKEDLEKMKELFYSNCYIYAYYKEKCFLKNFCAKFFYNLGVCFGGLFFIFISDFRIGI